MELRKEARDLLFCMLRKGDWITGEELSRMLDWNKKKVQQNIKWLMEDIGQEGNIETQKNKGYRVCRISECLRNEILKDAFYNEVYFNLDERRIILIMDLLFRRQYIPMDQLALCLKKSVRCGGGLVVMMIFNWKFHRRGVSIFMARKRINGTHALHGDRSMSCK